MVYSTLHITLRLLALCLLIVAASPVFAGWRDVMTHPTASRQPTETGRSIAELQRFGSKIHIGYGDYAANTGPISVFSYSAPARRLMFQSLNLATEAIFNYRRIGGRIVAVSADPRDPARDNFAIANVTNPKKWTLIRGLGETSGSSPSAHLYDMVWHKGYLWASGGMLNRKAGLWRSANNGRTWSLALSQGSTSGFYFIGIHADRLYVQAFDHCYGQGCAHPRSRMYDGERWRNGPDLLRGRGMGYAPDQFRGQLIMRTHENAYYPSYLHAFDGLSVRDPLPWTQPIHDYAIGPDRYLYVLTADINSNDGVNGQHILRTNDLDTWECIFDAPRRGTARTIEAVQVVDKLNRKQIQIFLGTTQSSLTRRDIRDRANCDGWW